MTMTEIIINQISLPYTEPEGEAIAIAKKKLKQAHLKFRSLSVYRCSVDSRRRQQIKLVRSIYALVEGDVTDEQLKALGASRAVPAYDPAPVMGTRISGGRPIIVGFGPAGMFAALLLAEKGYRPIVLERGGDVASRVKAVDGFMNGGALDCENNVQFGAGGAGTFSDGKLTTRINDPACRYILEQFVRFGAHEDILTQGKPHIGTDMLRGVVSAISDEVIRLGGEIHYNTRFDGIKSTRGGRVTSVLTSNGDMECQALIAAFGHSARDTYTSLMKHGFDVVPKSFSVGVRIEQLQSIIDRAVYGNAAGDSRLPVADYAFSWRDGDCGVYTFCMCPGGSVVAAASEEGGLVVNGMSDRLRGNTNANAALVVGVSPDEPMEFQRKLERAAYEMGGGDYRAPIQTAGGFLSGKVTEPTTVKPSYTRGMTKPARVDTLFDENVTRMLREGLVRFERAMPGFAPESALLTAAETRTSSPYRVKRLDGIFTAEGFENVYPCGEGAGYAGGIMSAAADGLRCAGKLISEYAPYNGGSI